MKAYSVDLRERVLAALGRGMSRASVVDAFQVSEGSIKRWLRTRVPRATCRRAVRVLRCL